MGITSAFSFYFHFIFFLFRFIFPCLLLCLSVLSFCPPNFLTALSLCGHKMTYISITKVRVMPLSIVSGDKSIIPLDRIDVLWMKWMPKSNAPFAA